MARAKHLELSAKLNLRMPESLQAKVDRDAEKRGLSMNAVIIARLEGSFAREKQQSEAIDDFLGGKATAALIREFLGAAGDIETKLGVKSWLDNPAAFTLVRDLWLQILDRYDPKKGGTTASIVTNLVNAISERPEADAQLVEAIKDLLGSRGRTGASES